MGHSIATLRRMAGLSQRGLAAKSGVPQSRIAEAEAGTRPLTVEACLKSAPVLGVDPISLYLSQTIPALKASIRSGKEPPTKAATVARALIEVIETGQLSGQQRKAARHAVEELVALVDEAAEQRGAGTLSGLVRGSGGPLDPPMRDDEDELQRVGFSDAEDARETGETNEYLGRDVFGRRAKTDGGDYVDPDADYFPESGTPALNATFGRKKKPGKASTKSTETTYEALDRDPFGRKRPSP